MFYTKPRRKYTGRCINDLTGGSRREFRTAFDALQLQACGLAPPNSMDVFIAPQLATPAAGTVLYAAASSAGGGDGSKVRQTKSWANFSLL